jgi:bifunctional non-homologous end joining protein LigD
MQKNTPDHYPPFIERHTTPKEGGGVTVYPVVDSVEAIVFFANQGVITFHAPPVRVSDIYHPDWVIWDLDPSQPGADKVRRAAHTLRDVLDAFGVPVRPMTSGSRGYHLRAELSPGPDAEDVASLARGVAVLAAEAHPELLTVEFMKKKRGDRVFVDWLRNAPYSTAVAPWSLRPRATAPVAVPLAWEEVDEVEPDGIDLKAAVGRLESDPWRDLKAIDATPAIEKVAQSLEEAGIELQPFDRFRS